MWQHVLAHELLLGHLGHQHGAIAAEHDDVIDLRAFAHLLVLAQAAAPAGEAFLAVHVELAIGHGHLGGHDGIEGAQLGAALAADAVFLLQLLEILDGVVDQVGELVLRLLDLLLQVLDVLVGLEAVVLRDALDLDLGEPHDVLVRHRAAQLLQVAASGPSR